MQLNHYIIVSVISESKDVQNIHLWPIDLGL